MKFDHLIQVLLPHDEKFYQYFEEMTDVLVRGCQQILKLCEVPTLRERESIVQTLHDIEHEGDNITHKIFGELNATFVTPFDREDIHVLASALDDILDYTDGSAGRLVLYKVEGCPLAMREMMDILLKQVLELKKGVAMLRDLRQSAKLQEVLTRVNEYENDADRVFETAIADLFENEKDAIKIIKLKEIYVGLETATDKCEDAANVLETILIKHA